MAKAYTKKTWIDEVLAGAETYNVSGDYGTDSFTIEHGTGNISCANETGIDWSGGVIIYYNEALHSHWTLRLWAWLKNCVGLGVGDGMNILR